jgi:hypothetical protein
VLFTIQTFDTITSNANTSKAVETVLINHRMTIDITKAIPTKLLNCAQKLPFDNTRVPNNFTVPCKSDCIHFID